MYSQITGICVSASDNPGKRKRTFKDFPKSITNGKFYAEENEFEFISDGKYFTIALNSHIHVEYVDWNLKMPPKFLE